MKTITFSCETITPMFLSGADGQKPELRPPSIKGALRFWWRAMNGGNWETLKNQEDRIFGSTKEALFSIQLGKEDFKKVKQNSKNGLPNRYKQAFREGEPEADIFKYMAYGAEDRKFIQENNFTFNVIFTFYLRILTTTEK
jgi:CRISPR-associated protein Cmr1